MIKRDVMIAFRSLMKQKKYTFINIFGIAVGLMSFVLISIWVMDELSYDTFHKEAENVHIVLRKQNDKRGAFSSKLLAPAIKKEVPEIKEATCFLQLPESFNSLFEYDGKSLVEKFSLADKHFFDVFSFPLLKGDVNTIFDNPSSVLISERARKKYFGEEDALNKSIYITVLGTKKLLTVSGVMKDIPHNSHIQTDIVLPFEFMNQFGVNWDVWHNFPATTYIRTHKKVSTSQLEETILTCKQRHYPEENIRYEVMPISKVHLHSSNVDFFSTTGDIKYVYIFSAIALVVLLIACMNYMNLSNALSLKRTKEIGVKKVQGSNRIQIVKQFLGETLLLVTIAAIISIALVQISLPVLNYVAGKSLSISYTSPIFILTLLAIVVLTSLISGIYPALFVSGFKPVMVLKGKYVSSPNSINVRKGLVVFQFVLSIIIIIGTITISRQLKYIQSANLGYNEEQIVCAQIRGDISKNFEAFRNEILSSGNVLNISRSANMSAGALGRTEGVNWPGKQDKFQAWVLNVDEHFADTYGIGMKEGRFYSSDFASDLSSGFVLNEAAVKEMGFENPIGQEMTMWGRKGRIIGVSKDFHFSSLHNKIEPLILHIPDPDKVNSRCNTLSMRIKPNSLPNSLEYIKDTWNSFFPDENFDYYFVDEQLKSKYIAESRMGMLFKYFSFLVILIACLGLYGLTAFTTEQKSKEIGVHKVMGATTKDVMVLFSKGFIYWLILASTIATPIAYYAMHKWLQNFAYKTELSWWIFALAGVLALGIALLTVSWQSWKAATRNPVEALRYE